MVLQAAVDRVWNTFFWQRVFFIDTRVLDTKRPILLHPHRSTGQIEFCRGVDAQREEEEEEGGALENEVRPGYIGSYANRKTY
jgi:hypothetical protein